MWCTVVLRSAGVPDLRVIEWTVRWWVLVNRKFSWVQRVGKQLKLDGDHDLLYRLVVN